MSKEYISLKQISLYSRFLLSLPFLALSSLIAVKKRAKHEYGMRSAVRGLECARVRATRACVAGPALMIV
jgi:hypothetical protein